MKVKDIYIIREVIDELWDFFTTNTDSDETGLVDSLSPKYEKAKKAIKEEAFRIHLKNATQRELRKLKLKNPCK